MADDKVDKAIADKLKAVADAKDKLAKQKAKDQRAKAKAEQKHQKLMETDAKYAHDYQIASTKKWREDRFRNATAEQEILDQKAINERKFGDVREKNLHDATKARQKNEDSYATELAESRAERSRSGKLAAKFAKEKAATSKEVDGANLEKQLEKMNGIFGQTDQSNELTEEFKSLKTQLANPQLTELEREGLNAQVDQLKLGADAEEERREKQADLDANASYLRRIADGAEKTAQGFEGLRDSLLAGGGIVAALGVVALLFFDPEKLMEGITAGIEKIRKILDGIRKFIDGDFQGGMEELEGSWGTIGAAVALITFYIGGKLIRAVGAVSTAFTKIAGALGKVKKFVQFMRLKAVASATSMGTFFGSFGKGIKAVSIALRAGALAAGTAMGSMLSGMLAFLAPFAIPIAIAAGIALVVAGIGFALTKLRDSLGFASVWDVIWLGVAYLKDGLAKFANMFIDLTNMIMGLVNKFGRWLGIDFEIPKMKRMETNNAEKYKEGALERGAIAKAEKAKQEAEEAQMKQDAQVDILEVDTDTNKLIELNALNESSMGDIAALENLPTGKSADTSMFDKGVTSSVIGSSETLEKGQARLLETQALSIKGQREMMVSQSVNNSGGNNNSSNTTVYNQNVGNKSSRLYSKSW